MILEAKEKSAQSDFHTDDEESFAIHFPTYCSVEELLENEHVDVLDIVVDEKNHYPVAKYALENGLHIIVEKPFVTEYKHALDLVDIARKRNSKLFVGHILRFDRRMQYIKDKISCGDIGKVRYLSCKRNFQSIAHSVYGRVNPFYSAMVHDIDLCLWFTKRKVIDIYGKVKYLLNHSNPDVLVALLELEEDILCRIENVWHVAGACPYGFENETVVYGSKSTIISRNVPIVEVWGKGEINYPEFFFWPLIMGKREGALKDMLEHYARCILDDTDSPIITLDEVLETIRIAEKLVECTQPEKRNAHQTQEREDEAPIQ